MKKSGKRRAAELVCAFIAALLTCVAVQAVGKQLVQAEKKALHTRVREAAISCYAAEGRYPKVLSYLEEAYGLRYDKSRFVVYYDAFASNVLPDIDVQAREGAWTR